MTCEDLNLDLQPYPTSSSQELAYPISVKLAGLAAVLQLLKIMDDWTTQLDSGGQIDVIYTDFAKALQMQMSLLNL